MTKVYELPNDHRMIADIDETTRTCTITETQLDSLISKLNYYAEGQDEVLDKIRDEIETYEADCILADDSKECKECDKVVFGSIYRIIDKYTKGESE